VKDILAPKPLIYDGVERPYRVEDHIERDHNGRPRILVVDEQGRLTGERTTYTRCTTYIQGIEGEREHLNVWKLVQALKGYTLSPLIYAARLAACWGAEDEKPRVKEIVEEMQEFARMSERALLGTAIHALSERHDLGLPTPIFPEPYQPHLAEWRRLTAPWQPFEHWQVERFMVNDLLKVGGTPDRLLMLRRPCPRCGGLVRIGDLKTGRVDDFTQREIEMQEAVYAHSKVYDPETGERIQVPICTCKGYVFKIPAVDLEDGRGELLELDLERGWDLASNLMPQIRQARRYKPKFRPVDPLALMVEQAESVEHLKTIWIESTQVWTDTHTEIASRRRRELEAAPTNGGT